MPSVVQALLLHTPLQMHRDIGPESGALPSSRYCLWSAKVSAHSDCHGRGLQRSSFVSCIVQ